MINFLILSEAVLNGKSSFDIKKFSRELYLCGFKTRKIEVSYPDIKKLNTFIFECEKRQDVNIVFSDLLIDVKGLEVDEYKIFDDIKVYTKNQAYFIFLKLDYYKSLKTCVEELLAEHSKQILQLLRCFGKSENELRLMLKEFVDENFSNDVSGNRLKCDIILKARDEKVLNQKTLEVMEKIKDYVYAESDIEIENEVFNLLKINDKTIAFAESITGGNIARRFVAKNPGASKYLREGLVVYTNDAKISRLGVTKETIESLSAVSDQTAYEMATGLLDSADIVVAITGYASSLETPGLVYIAIGDKEKIDVFKANFKGSREEIIDSASDAVFFYLVKKLR